MYYYQKEKEQKLVLINISAKLLAEDAYENPFKCGIKFPDGKP